MKQAISGLLRRSLPRLESPETDERLHPTTLTAQRTRVALPSLLCIALHGCNFILQFCIYYSALVMALNSLYGYYLYSRRYS
jgi:hypothetical protein